MHLTPKETDRLFVFLAGELARRRRERGLKLNYPEATALIADAMHEGAREGKSVADLMSEGASILTTDDVQPGVAELVGTLQVEGMFLDGQKLITLHDPIQPGQEPITGVEPGEIQLAEEDVILNEGRESLQLTVRNTGDRPVQVGSHYHFFEVNSELDFDRSQAFGKHLNIPAGTSARFEPGDEKEVELVAIGGQRKVHGLNRLTQGDTGEAQLSEALRRASESGFKGVS